MSYIVCDYAYGHSLIWSSGPPPVYVPANVIDQNSSIVRGKEHRMCEGYFLLGDDPFFYVTSSNSWFVARIGGGFCMTRRVHKYPWRCLNNRECVDCQTLAYQLKGTDCL